MSLALWGHLYSPQLSHFYLFNLSSSRSADVLMTKIDKRLQSNSISWQITRDITTCSRPNAIQEVKSRFASLSTVSIVLYCNLLIWQDECWIIQSSRTEICNCRELRWIRNIFCRDFIMNWLPVSVTVVLWIV